jgi:regulator of replication initiation timing
VAPIIEAIKELASNVKNNTTEIDALRSENILLKKRLDAIEARLAK